MATDRVAVHAASEGDVQFTTFSGATWSAPKGLCLRSNLFAQLFSRSQAVLHDETERRDHVEAPKRGRDATQEDQKRAPASVRVYPRYV